MRKEKALINIFFTLLLEVVSVLSGFVIPYIMIVTFGSNINGLIHSIASFLGYIAILQLGAGSVIKASLYRPLAKCDKNALNTIVKASNVFFTKIGTAGIIYMVILAIIYPIFIFSDNGFAFTSSLVIIIGLGTIAQYLFGITYQMVLEADQRSYIYSSAQIITIVLNTISVYFLAKYGCTVQVVKLVSSLFFVLRPIAIGVYVREKYGLNTDVPYNDSLITQRWSGFAHGLALFIHSKTGIFVLTFFSTLSNISVFSVYAAITNGLTALISSIDKAVRSAFGNMIAKEETEILNRSFSAYNTLIQMLSATCFSTAAITIYKFISLYVKNVTDADYNQPIFAILIITAEMFYCLRLPYNSIVFAGNKFADTKDAAIIEAAINILLSVVLVHKYGLLGVAIGALFAMIYRTISFVVYLHKNFLFLNYVNQTKRFATTLIAYLLSILLFSRLEISVSNYLQWLFYASVIFMGAFFINIIVNYIFCRNELFQVYKKICSINFLKK